MKKKLLWIWIPSVLIVGVAGFIFFNTKSWDVDLGDEKNDQYHGTVGNDVEKKTFSDYECYDEYGDRIFPEYDSDGNIINCWDKLWYPIWKQISYYDNWNIETIFIVEEWKYAKYYENWQISEEWNVIKEAINHEDGKKWYKLIRDGMWVYYYENWNKKTEWNYKNWQREWEWIGYYENWNISIENNYKNWILDWKSITYNEDWDKVTEWMYKNWKEEWEHIIYIEWIRYQKLIFENGEILEIQDNPDVADKVEKRVEERELKLKSLWNKFESWVSLDEEEFWSLMVSMQSDYGLYYGDETKDLFEDVYRYEYEDKAWELPAIYSMMNCSEDPSNPDTYLFNLDDPKLAQEIYFKNCPKWCKYSDEEDIDFVCE